MNTRKFNWGFKSEPERFLNDRIMNCPRGRVLGGSSSINGMVYVRGNPFDFDEWEMLGQMDGTLKIVFHTLKESKTTK